MNATETKDSLMKREPGFNPIVRPFLGCMGGFVGSLILIVITFVRGPGLLGMLVSGQYLFFQQLFFAAIPSYEVVFLTSFLAYSAVWGLIMSLIISRERTRQIAGWILFIAYIILGFVSLNLYGSLFFPT